MGCPWKPQGIFESWMEWVLVIAWWWLWSQLGGERVRRTWLDKAIEWCTMQTAWVRPSLGKCGPYYYWYYYRISSDSEVPSCRISMSILSLPPWCLCVSLSFPMEHIVSRIKAPILTSIARTGLWPWNSLIMVNPRKWVDYCSLMQHPFSLVWPSGLYLLPQMANTRSGLKSASWMSITWIILFAMQATRLPGT